MVTTSIQSFDESNNSAPKNVGTSNRATGYLIRFLMLSLFGAISFLHQERITCAVGGKHQRHLWASLGMELQQWLKDSFHCLACGRNETLVIVPGLFNYSIICPKHLCISNPPSLFSIFQKCIYSFVFLSPLFETQD